MIKKEATQGPTQLLCTCNHLQHAEIAQHRVSLAGGRRMLLSPIVSEPRLHALRLQRRSMKPRSLHIGMSHAVWIMLACASSLPLLERSLNQGNTGWDFMVLSSNVRCRT
mmetsp:Transcript_26082/g.49955  ORF Transcript_26082/g.49955 Transcript_26082/m.49955 type:complete len:110 (-) Transcript_26082:1019-1348(-)